MKPIDPKLILQTLGQTIVALRKSRGIAQDRLAHDAVIERAHMSGIERGKFNAGFATVYRVLPVLGVTLSQFAVEFDRILRQRNRKHNKVN